MNVKEMSDCQLIREAKGHREAFEERQAELYRRWTVAHGGELEERVGHISGTYPGVEVFRRVDGSLSGRFHGKEVHRFAPDTLTPGEVAWVTYNTLGEDVRT